MTKKIKTLLVYSKNNNKQISLTATTKITFYEILFKVQAGKTCHAQCPKNKNKKGQETQLDQRKGDTDTKQNNREIKFKKSHLLF